MPSGPSRTKEADTVPRKPHRRRLEAPRDVARFIYSWLGALRTETHAAPRTKQTFRGERVERSPRVLALRKEIGLAEI